MKTQTKLIFVGIISIVFSVTSFFVLDGDRNANLFMNVFEIAMLSVLTFFLLAINFFAIRFCIRRITEYMNSKKEGK
ncbi:hypothetical protein [Flavobacterium soli]|uniref:hypothetical protein n=1 Tax=Flavobacterium soli TaxID=344881 RepID=UPI00047E8959|nr:hypothetical protein [Flavobacterium soli]